MQRQAKTKDQERMLSALKPLWLFWVAGCFCLMLLFYGSIFLETSNPMDFLPFFAHVIGSLVLPQTA